jgi:RNase H-like domain found in reverse transcriptase
VKPLTNLLKKGTTFLWTDECTTALNHLKHIITLEPVLIPPDQECQFILKVNASQFTTGAILYQADKKMIDCKGNWILCPCRYHSQMFLATEQCYPIYDCKFLAVIHGLKHWDYLLKFAQHPVLVITDHANLTYYHHPYKIGQQVAGYIAEYKQYDTQLAYHPGVSNRADTLS